MKNACSLFTTVCLHQEDRKIGRRVYESTETHPLRGTSSITSYPTEARFIRLDIFAWEIDLSSTLFAAFTGPVVSVLDGDTIPYNNQPERIHLNGIIRKSDCYGV